MQPAASRSRNWGAASQEETQLARSAAEAGETAELQLRPDGLYVGDAGPFRAGDLAALGLTGRPVRLTVTSAVTITAEHGVLEALRAARVAAIGIRMVEDN